MNKKTCLLTADSHPTLGENLNGPCVIEVPSWVQSPLGRYYLYFAHHEGRFIRLAYSDDLTGPWKIHAEGVLNLNETPFAQTDLPLESGLEYTYAHIASPNVHMDENTQEIVMFYHGMEEDGLQTTRVCFSKDGLAFRRHSDPLAEAYFAGFSYGDAIYAITLGGHLCRGKRWLGPFEYAGNAFRSAMIGSNGETPRHFGVKADGDILHIYFSRIGDAPERILKSTCDMTTDWRDWRASSPVEILRPTEGWEGALGPIEKSLIGTAAPMEHALRDPFPFQNHLFFAGGGESTIGVTELPEEPHRVC